MYCFNYFVRNSQGNQPGIKLFYSPHSGETYGHYFQMLLSQERTLHRSRNLWAQAASQGQPAQHKWCRTCVWCIVSATMAHTVLHQPLNSAVTLLFARPSCPFQNRSTPEMSASVTALVGIRFSFLTTEAFMQTYLGWWQVILLAELTASGNCSDLSARKKGSFCLQKLFFS